MKCPRCGLEMDGSKCNTCGYELQSTRTDEDGDAVIDESTSLLKNYGTTIALYLFIAFLVIILILLVGSIEIIFPETLAYEESPTPDRLDPNQIFLIMPVAISLGYLGSTAFAAYYLLMVAAIVFSVFYLFYKGWDDMVEYLRDVFRGNFKKIEKNRSFMSSPVLRLVTIFTALLFFSQMYLIIIEIFAGLPEMPGFDQRWKEVYSVMRASVWEELITRVLYIGAPMALLGLYKGSGAKKIGRYLFGGFGFERRLVVILVVVSSIIFGVAHIGGGLFRIPHAGVAGIVFGYLYVKDGIHSAIILHFFWNFRGVPDMLLNIPNYQLFHILLTFIWMGVGAYFSYRYLKSFGKWFQGRPFEDEEESEDVELEEKAEPKTAGVTTGYVCPNCSYDKAIYTEKSKLRCKRCGRETDPKSDHLQDNAVKVSRDQEWPPT